MLRKIITYFLILAVVLPIFASAIPLGMNRAQAEDTTEKTSNDGTVYDPCDFNVIARGALSAVGKAIDVLELTEISEKTGEINKNSGGSVWDCTAYTIVNISYDFIMTTAIIIAGWASDIFNISIQFALTGKTFDPNENTMIKDGWTMVRDLLNLVFIFILLYAAISTILQYGNMDIKKILPSLIIAALLINFSMLITKMVIDASHIFAWEFYNQIDVTKGGTVANMKGSVEVKGDFEKKNLANVFMASFNPQRLLIESGMAMTTKNKDDIEEIKPAPWKNVVEKATEKREGFMSTLGRMAIIIWFETALALYAAFILMAVAIMVVARVVVLWAVMIFSPIAFLGMILPSMKEYSGIWWKYLIGQSFFVPAFLFMFMLTTKFIDERFIDNLLHLTKNNDLNIVTGLDMSEIVSMSFNFLIVGGLMALSLIVARQLGGKTAEFGIGGAHKIKGLAMGGALKYIPKPLLRHTVGKVSSDMAKSEWAEKMAAKSPTFGGWAKGILGKGGDVGGFSERMEQRIKAGQNLSTTELRAQYFKNLSAREQAEWYSKASARTRVELEDAAIAGGHAGSLKNIKGFYGKLSLEEQEKTIKSRAEVDLKKTDQNLADIFLGRSEEIQKEIINQMKDGRKSGFIDKLTATHGFAAAVDSTTLTGKNIRKFRPDYINTGTTGGIASLEESIKSHKTEDILLLNENIANNPEVIREMVKQYKGAQVNKIIERGDGLYTKFKDELSSIAGGSVMVSDVVHHLQRIGNPALASLIQSNEIMQKSLGLV